MSLSDHIRSLGGTATLQCQILAGIADSARCSYRTLYMIALGHKRASALLATRIEQATNGAVTRHDLREDVFGPAPADAQPDTPAPSAPEQEAA